MLTALPVLDATDGLSSAQLQQANRLHRTTVARRLDKLVAHGLAIDCEGLYYNHHRCHTALGGRPPISRVNNAAGQYS
ncbi:transposase [Streptomyces hygroscopicus subsp. jinggangensis 5008]|nr:transposase [Streptomyces hygroscopicus subsp. jinggangensis 5008]AGF59719.1 transposase [Streptomyces hygroscopicus subsp. jinggangensis TL01]